MKCRVTEKLLIWVVNVLRLGPPRLANLDKADIVSVNKKNIEVQKRQNVNKMTIYRVNNYSITY